MKYSTMIVSLLAAVVMMSALAGQVIAQDKGPTEVKNPDVVLRVTGMVCDLCALSLEDELKEIDAVNIVQVKLDEQRVLLTLRDDQTVTAETLREAVAKAGFTTEEVTFTKKDTPSKTGSSKEGTQA
jgi:copper chaperone CopZ